MVGETDLWLDDFMGRKPSCDFLTNYILANEHVKVLNVNSPWGSGKTFFLERWKAELSKRHVCVFFNAWETDYSAEPLLALVTCIEQQTKDKLDVTSTEAGRRAVNLSAKLLKKAAPLIAKGLVKKYVGVELDDLFGEGSGDDTADSASELVSSLFEDQANTIKQVEAFKAAVVERLSNAAEDNSLESPAFIFIDELDRCRPTYAIELLERIKHFFELKGCRFIIASDSRQLAHSIRAVYGQNFSSEQYLNRFFDAEFNLDNSDLFALVNHSLPGINSIRLNINIRGEAPHNAFDRSRVSLSKTHTVRTGIEGFTENQLIVVGLCRYFKVELRELSNYIKQIKSAADTIGGDIHFFWLAYLVFFKASKADEYNDLRSPDKWRQALEDFEKKAGGIVTFSIVNELCSIRDLAQFYIVLLLANKTEFRDIGTGLNNWQASIYHSGHNGVDIEPLRTYRDVVELAHRLK